MTTGWRWGLVALVAAGMLLAGPTGDAEARRGRKAKIKCRIDGEKFKTNARGGGAGGIYEQPAEELALIGGRAKIKGRNPATVRTDVRTLSMIVLPIEDLTTATYPLVVPVSSTSFSRTITNGFSIVEAKVWEGEGVTMTITSFNGTRLKGTAEGMIPALVGTEAPALVENCKFSLNLSGVPLQ